MTEPAVEHLHSHTSLQRQDQDGDPTPTQSDPQNGTVTGADPSGGVAELPKAANSEGVKTDDYPQGLSKYEVGWRRIVRHFSPS